MSSSAPERTAAAGEHPPAPGSVVLISKRPPVLLRPPVLPRPPAVYPAAPQARLNPAEQPQLRPVLHPRTTTMPRPAPALIPIASLPASVRRVSLGETATARSVYKAR